jgi:FAD/FMN-containing dehydrogenase
LEPEHGEYENARRIQNGLIDRCPALIVRCSGTADVVEAVNFARDRGLLLSIRGGGHNVAGNATNDGGLVIDLSAMRGVHVDPDTTTVRAAGGATMLRKAYGSNYDRLVTLKMQFDPANLFRMNLDIPPSAAASV